MFISCIAPWLEEYHCCIRNQVLKRATPARHRNASLRVWSRRRHKGGNLGKRQQQEKCSEDSHRAALLHGIGVVCRMAIHHRLPALEFLERRTRHHPVALLHWRPRQRVHALIGAPIAIFSLARAGIQLRTTGFPIPYSLFAALQIPAYHAYPYSGSTVPSPFPNFLMSSIAVMCVTNFKLLAPVDRRRSCQLSAKCADPSHPPCRCCPTSSFRKRGTQCSALAAARPPLAESPESGVPIHSAIYDHPSSHATSVIWLRTGSVFRSASETTSGCATVPSYARRRASRQ